MNQILCKWVDEDMKTRNNTKWKVGVPKELPEQDDHKLCRKGLFHYYEHPLIAVILKALSLCENYTKLYEVLPEGKIVKGIDESGSTKLTLIKELEIPEFTLDQKIAFGILCAKEVYEEENFVSWANDWLSGKDRSLKSAAAVYAAVCDASVDADAYAAKAAGNAVDASADAVAASKAATYASDVASAYASGASCADSLAAATVDAVNSAAYWASSNVYGLSGKEVDLVSLVEQAMKIQ